MSQEKLLNEIMNLEREISMLPCGSITKKKIRDKEYFYHRITQNGKRIETYLSFENEPELRKQIEKRKDLEKKLKNLKKEITSKKNIEKTFTFHTMVRYGEMLKSQIAITRKYKKRECIQSLREYITGPMLDKVFILYGLRRTGKTTMIRQILTELSDIEFNKAAYIQIQSKDTLDEVNDDLKNLEKNGFKYIFIDEVTLMDDFIEGAALFSDIYASSGIKVVLSGTDSLGFAFSKEEQLYDRCILLHTTFIPYREFENVLGIKGIDEYIRYGGTMSLGGINYNEDTPFSNAKNAKEYVDSAIAKNIQHSLKLYEHGGHFRQLLDLYEKNELTNVINRVVEDINHKFTKSVIEKTFKSNDLSLTAANLLKDRQNPINIKKHLDMDVLTFSIMKMLEILNKEEQSIDIEEDHMVQIKEYLSILDLITEIDLESLPMTNKKSTITVITQPGLRYAQAQAIVESMLMDVNFQELSAIDRKFVLDRLLSEIKGRMMEDIVLLETKMANPDKKVFKLQFAIGEFDMVIFDPDKITCNIYEIKHSLESVPQQYHHLKDEKKCEMTTHRYGTIEGKYVIYRGESKEMDDISYVNVEEYLKSL